MADKKLSFSIGEAFGFGWSKTKSNLIFLIGLVLIIGVINAFPGVVVSAGGKDAVALAFVVRIIGWVLQMIVTLGSLAVMLALVDGKKPSYEDLWTNVSKVLNYIVAGILYGVIVVVGLILLIIPGIYFGLKFMFYGYAIVDKGMGPIEALKYSGKLTSGVKWKLILLHFASFGVALLGVIALVVGLLVAIPVIMLAQAYVYRTLQKQVG